MASPMSSNAIFFNLECPYDSTLWCYCDGILSKELAMTRKSQYESMIAARESYLRCNLLGLPL